MNKLDMLKELYPEDLLGLARKLTEGEVEVLFNLRQALNTEIQPVMAEYWDKAEFPVQVYDLYSRVGIMNHSLLFEGREGKPTYSEVYNAFLFHELARTDTSIATAYTIHRMAHTVILQGGTEEQKADEAYRIGLFNRLVEPVDLMPETVQYAQTIVSKGPIAVKFVKQAVKSGYEMALEQAVEFESELFGAIFSTEDQVEGMAAFIEKRPAEFKNR